MKLLEMDAGNLKKKTMKEVPEDSKKFAGKILQDFVAEFDLSNPENKKKFDDIKNSKIDFGGIQKDISFLLSISMRR